MTNRILSRARAFSRRLAATWLAIVLAVPALLAVPSATPARDFSFVHIADIHIPQHFEMPRNLQALRGYPCTSTLKDLGPIRLTPYDVTAPAPSFVVATGDIVEFSFPGVTWQVVDKYFEGVKVPVYMTGGNHDNTWVATPEEFRRRFGGMNYSFDHEGMRFVVINSGTLQEPLPSFGEEVVRFVRDDLANLDASTPVVLLLHHPLHDRSFASRFEFDRLLDVLRPYNVIVALYGHGHQPVHHRTFGLDGVMGGSPFNKDNNGSEGYNIVHVQGDTLRIAYRRCNEDVASRAVFEKKIPARATYPAIDLFAPFAFQKWTEPTLSVLARIADAPAPIVAAAYSIDDAHEGELDFEDGLAMGTVDVSNLTNGAHFLRVVFKDADDNEYTRAHPFFVETAKDKGTGQALWHRQLPGASKATPLVHRGVVYLGTNDGKFYALDARTGREHWVFDAQSEILTTAAVYRDSAWLGLVNRDLVLFGAANGKVYALDRKGRIQWTYATDNAVFSSPTIDKKAGVVYFGTNNARLVALEVETGRELWVNSDARYAIESPPFVHGGAVYFGAWDGYLYAVDAETGETRWKAPGPKNQERVVIYYGPADNPPVVTDEGVLYICDRGYVAGRYSAADGRYLGTVAEDTSGLTLAADQQSLYLRRTGHPLQKVDLDGNPIWTTSAVGGRLPVSPTVRGGKVYLCDNTGRLTVFDDKTGEVRWTYQVAPQLFVMAAVAVDRKGTVYTVDTAGNLMAVAPRK